MLNLAQRLRRGSSARRWRAPSAARRRPPVSWAPASPRWPAAAVGRSRPGTLRASCPIRSARRSASSRRRGSRASLAPAARSPSRTSRGTTPAPPDAPTPAQRQGADQVRVAVLGQRRQPCDIVAGFVLSSLCPTMPCPVPLPSLQLLRKTDAAEAPTRTMLWNRQKIWQMRAPAASLRLASHWRAANHALSSTPGAVHSPGADIGGCRGGIVSGPGRPRSPDRACPAQPG